MRRYLLVILFFFSLENLNAQISHLFFVSGGVSIATDVIITDSKFQDMNGYSLNYQHLQWNYTTLMLDGRMNLFTIGNSSSVSISTIPSVGFGMAYEIYDGGTWYSLGAGVPAFLEYNFGNASQYNALQNFGFVVGLGYEYHIYPLIAYPVSETHLNVSEFRKIWSQPVFELGLRYYNKKNRAKEVNFKLGYGDKGKDFIIFGGNTENAKQTMSFRVAFVRFFNY
jgi:hypothetical protein